MVARRLLQRANAIVVVAEMRPMSRATLRLAGRPDVERSQEV